MLNSQEKLQEAVQYSYYSKWLTENLFHYLLNTYDPTPNKYFGRWLVETFIRTIIKPLIVDWRKRNPDRSESDEELLKLLNLIMTTSGISDTLKGYYSEGYHIFLGTNYKHFNNYYFDIREALEVFYKVKGQLPPEKRDIMSYKTFGDLINYMESEEIDAINEKLRFANVGKDEYNVIYKDDTWFIVQPLTEPAACKYGQNTKWCTAARENNRFDYYNRDGPLIIFMKKLEDGRVQKWQIHEESRQWMDERDEQIDRDKFIAQVPEKAKIAVFNSVKSLPFLGKENLERLAESLLDTNDENQYLKLVVNRYSNERKDEIFVEESSRHTYFSKLFGEKIGQFAYSDYYYGNDFDQDPDSYAYNEGYEKPWEYLTEDPEYAEDIEICGVCQGEKYGLYVWNNELHDWDSSLTQIEYDTKKRIYLTSPNANEQAFDSLYKLVGDRYHVVDKEAWITFNKEVGFTCPKCRGSGKADGPHWNRDIELWSEDQRERAAQEAEQKAQNYAFESDWREFNRYGWEDMRGADLDDIIDKVLKFLLDKKETSIPREERINTIKTLLKFAGSFQIDVPIPEGFTIGVA